VIDIPPAAVRLFDHAMRRQVEIEDEITDSLSNEELLARSERLLRGSRRLLNNNPDAKIEIEDEDEDDAKIEAALAKDPEYLYFRAELARVLKLGPADINPLDSFECDDEPVNLRAYELKSRLFEAHLDWVLGRFGVKLMPPTR
jgi:hypothetical protein